MNHSIPSYLYPYMLAGNVAMVATVLAGLSASLRRATWSDRERGQAFGTIAALFLGWWILAMGLSWMGVYDGSRFRAPTIQYGVVVPIAVGVLLYWRWAQLRRVVETIPQPWFVGVQLYRVLGGIFLILHFQGRMPGQFAWPAGAGDILVGLMAPFVAFAYSRGGANSATLVRVWNWMGILDLVIAVSTGFLTSPSPLQVLAFDAPNYLISVFPLATIPVFLVPMSILFHLASLKKLRQEERTA